MLQKISASIGYIIVGLIVLVLGGFGGWYYFLHKAQVQTVAESVARNYNGSLPSFVGSTGSTYQNIVSTYGQPGSSGSVSTSSRLWEASVIPVAGYAWGSLRSDPVLYFVERSTGYELEASTGDHSVTRLTDTLRPKTYEALVARDGSVIERSIDTTGTIITFAGVLATSTGTSSKAVLTGVLLPQNIAVIAIDSISRAIYYAIPQSAGITFVSSDWSGKKEQHLFSSSLSGWNVIAPGNGSLYVAQKPLDGSIGYAYKLQKDGSLGLVAEAPGLTLLPKISSPAFLYSASSGGSLSLFAQQNPAASVTTLPIKTVTEKCGWAAGMNSTSSVAYCGVPQRVPSQQFLDDWYKGVVHTSDTIYTVDTVAASSTVLFDPRGTIGTQLDITHLSVDPSGRFLAFINATDQSLWVLRITQ